MSATDNALIWRARVRGRRIASATTVVSNFIAAALVLTVFHERLQSVNGIPAWIWLSLCVILAGTTYTTWSRLKSERRTGGLEVLRSTPLLPDALLKAEVHLALKWALMLIPIYLLWCGWAVAGGALASFRILVLVGMAALTATSGALLGLRLGLSPSGSGWALLGGMLAALGLLGLPALTQEISPDPLTGGLLGLSIMCAVTAVLWQGAHRALDLEDVQPVGPTHHVNFMAPFVVLSDRLWLALTSPFGVQGNPFFMRERARSLRRMGRDPSIILTCLVSPALPLAVSLVFAISMPLALAWCAIPLLFMWWMTGAGMAKDALTRELDSRTLDALRASPLDPRLALTGMVMGRAYPLAVGWLWTMPAWLYIAVQPGVPFLAAVVQPMTLLAVAMVSAVPGVRASATSVALRGDARYYSEGACNPALWLGILLWPVGGTLAAILNVTVFPPDLVTLFPMWYSNPDLVSGLWFLPAFLMHGVVLAMAIGTDLGHAWKGVQRALNEQPEHEPLQPYQRL